MDFLDFCEYIQRVEFELGDIMIPYDSEEESCVYVMWERGDTVPACVEVMLNEPTLEEVL